MEPAEQELTKEIRWIRRGRFDDDVSAWFAQFAPVLETRQDTTWSPRPCLACP